MALRPEALATTAHQDVAAFYLVLVWFSGLG